MQVCVLGLGEVGLPTALYIAGQGLSVWGYDISENAVNVAKKEGVKATTRWDEVPPVDVYVVCVSTSLKSDKPDLTSLFNVCEKIAKSAKRSSLVSVESTILPGTCRKIHEKFFNGQLSVVHVPHRYWPGDCLRRGVKQIRVIGALDEKDMERGLRFYRDQLEIPLHIARVIEVAEMSKLAENAYRYVQIAFAEELRIICSELGLSFEQIREACNTKWNIEMLEARDGIKGSCLPKDIKYLESITKNGEFLKEAIVVDTAYRKWLARAHAEKNRLHCEQ